MRSVETTAAVMVLRIQIHHLMLNKTDLKVTVNPHYSKLRRLLLQAVSVNTRRSFTMTQAGAGSLARARTGGTLEKLWGRALGGTRCFTGDLCLASPRLTGRSVYPAGEFLKNAICMTLSAYLVSDATRPIVCWPVWLCKSKPCSC